MHSTMARRPKSLDKTSITVVTEPVVMPPASHYFIMMTLPHFQIINLKGDDMKKFALHS